MKTSQLIVGVRIISKTFFFRSTKGCVAVASNTQYRTFHHSVPKESSLRPQSIATPLRARKLLAGSIFQGQNIQLSKPSHLLKPPSRSYSSTIASISPYPTIHSIYEPVTGTWQYIIADPSTLSAVIIDPVLDYNPSTQTINTHTADSLLSLISQHGYQITRILETHAHADHLTAAAYLQRRLRKIQASKPPICIGKRIAEVQEVFGKRYGIAEGEYQGAFDELLDDDEVFRIGGLSAKVVHLPGHTPDHVGYVIGDNVFCGDSLFHTDIGTARCDFPGGSASSLYHSAQKLLWFPEDVKIWTGHDYLSEERDTPVPWLSVQEHKERNEWVKEGVTLESFVERRQERDKMLKAPRLLHPSLQVNIRAGRLPALTELELRFLQLPLKVDGEEW